jgi:hypothetical protein
MFCKTCSTPKLVIAVACRTFTVYHALRAHAMTQKAHADQFWPFWVCIGDGLELRYEPERNLRMLWSDGAIA